MPDPVTMTGAYACRGRPYDRVRVICVDGPNANRPVAFYAADGRLFGADRFGRQVEIDSLDLIPLQQRPKPMEAWALIDNAGTVKWVSWHANRTEAGLMLREYPNCRIVRVVEAPEDTAP
jgi:hypothetical protein